MLRQWTARARATFRPTEVLESRLLLSGTDGAENVNGVELTDREASAPISVLPAVLVKRAARKSPAAKVSAKSAKASVKYLARVMDQFHDRFPVYDDVSSAGNHFHGWFKIPSGDAPVDISGASTDNPHAGATAIRATLNNTGGDYGGFYFSNGLLPAGTVSPQPNFGDAPGAGVDLRGATALTFWAQGARGGEKVEFFMGGVGREAETGLADHPFPDSARRRPGIGRVTKLTMRWRKFRINLRGADLSYVVGGFGWVATVQKNPQGATFFLDDIQYELSKARQRQRLNEPRFLLSYQAKPLQPNPFDANKDDDIDFVLRNTAFTYDNALASLTFLADGSADSLRRARLIGDAFVYATQHDRSFTDGRLRSDYAGGDIALPPGWTPNGRPATVPVPGFYDEPTQKFYEVEQGATDTGNNAWAMIALLALYRRTGVQAYLDTAARIGEFVSTVRNDAGTYQGYLGGFNLPESDSPQPRRYASTEHNLDLHAAFTTLFEITGDPRWQERALHARQFVESMWDPALGCYRTGTIDPNSINTNPGQLPLDVQAWSVLSIPGLAQANPQALRCAEQHHRTAADGFTGFDFNDDNDGIWFEGTGQMAVAYFVAGQSPAAEDARAHLIRAQQVAGDGFGLPAASRDGLTTGFDFNYFRRLHIAATAWNVFAQTSFNPFYDSAPKNPQR